MPDILLVVETMPTPKMAGLLWSMLHQDGILREDCDILPLLGEERPQGSYQRPTAPQLARVLPAFREGVASTRYAYVVPCGGPAFRAVTGLTWSIDTSRAYVLTPDHCRPSDGKARVQIGDYKRDNKAKGISAGDPKFGMRIVPIPPALPRGCRYIIPSISIETVVKLRYRNQLAFRAAFRNLARLRAGESPLLLQHWENAPPPPGRVWEGAVAFDLECPFESFAVERASLSTGTETWTFEWGAGAVQAVREAMQGSNLRIAHNQQYDIPILAAHGIEVPEPTFDTMLAACLLEPDLSKSLASTAPLYLLIHPWKHLSDERGFADPEYSALDAFMEFQLAGEMADRLCRMGMKDLFHDRIMPSVPVLQDMKQQGIKLNPKAAEEWCGKLRSDIEGLTSEWVQLYPSVSPTSPHQIKKLLYETLKLPVQRRKGDGISTDELALRVLQKQFPKVSKELDILLKLRYAHKMLSAFGQTVLGHDRVHPSYLPMGKDAEEGQYGKGMAATGRLATSKPNIQQQPKEARILYVPDTPDYCFVEFDWSQAELRVAAALAGDVAMQNALEDDIHAHTMERLGCDRTRAKNVLYGSAYGAGPKKLREVLQQNGVVVDEHECKTLQDALASAYPVWWQWRYSIAAEAASRKYLRNPFGRIRRFPMGQEDVPAALDFLPQSCVADMAWSVYRQLWETARDLGGRLSTVVHDSFLVQVPGETLNEMLRQGKRILEAHFPEIAPDFYIPVTVKVGKPGASWGALEEHRGI